MKPVLIAALAVALATAALAATNSPAGLLRGYEAAAGATGSAARGKALFTGTHSGGKPDTPSCITCHTANLRAEGQTRAGKAIPPMAVSANPRRLTDSAFAEKWFGRNCNTVLGRECSAAEKADIVAYFMSL